MSSFIIKMIAIITMFIDHLGAALQGHMEDVTTFRGIGRIAFPLFAFLIAEGCRHTKDINKYIFRLGAFAIISQLPFYYFVGDLFYLNIFFTLTIAVICIAGAKKGKIYFALLCVAAIFATTVLHMDYGIMGVAVMVLLYFAKTKMKQMLVVLGFLFLLYNPNMSEIGLYFFLLGAVSLIPIMLYNGQKGFSNKYLQYGFYAFYPIHLAVLAIAALVLGYRTLGGLM